MPLTVWGRFRDWWVPPHAPPAKPYVRDPRVDKRLRDRPLTGVSLERPACFYPKEEIEDWVKMPVEGWLDDDGVQLTVKDEFSGFRFPWTSIESARLRGPHQMIEFIVPEGHVVYFADARIWREKCARHGIKVTEEPPDWPPDLRPTAP